MSFALHNHVHLRRPQWPTLKVPITIPLLSPHLSSKSPSRTICTRCRVSSSHNPHNPQQQSPSFYFQKTVLPFLFFLTIAVSTRFLAGLLPPDFTDRWRRLLAYAEEAELMCEEYPTHLFQAVVASEDRNFFRHVGVDLVGIGRAVVYFPRGGGGSTITQQLVKNVFLKSERKFSRKIVEMVLALALERNMTKWRILYSYLSMVYWGHGKYGVESASLFYFGKNPSLLTLGESAALAGILPSPELRSLFRDANRGKHFQARVLKKMVTAGFVDIKSALSIVSRPLYLCADGPEHLSTQLCFEPSREDILGVDARKTKRSAKNNVWDWEMASISWEAKEDMERWAMKRMKNIRIHFERRANPAKQMPVGASIFSNSGDLKANTPVLEKFR